MTSVKPTDLIQSVSRAIRILEAVWASREGLSAKQVARRCRLALPTAYHLLRTLCYERYLLRRPDGTYVLGVEIAMRFHDFQAALQRPPRVHHVLRHLSEVTGYTAYLSQVVDGRIMITDVVEGPRSPYLEDLIVGFAEGAHATALGKALLSTMPPALRRSYLREQGLRPFTGNTVRDPDALDHELDVLARHGTFVEQEQFREAVCCAAVLLGHDRVRGAIGVSASAEEWPRVRDRVARELKICASDLSRTTAVPAAGGPAHDRPW